jgi:hypothetical protein
MSNPGTYQQYVSKSGGNQLHGPTLAAADTNRLQKFQDFNADLGGYIIKDRLSYYGAFRYTKTGQAYSWLTDTVALQDAPVETGKLNLQPHRASENQRLLSARECQPSELL